MAKEHGVPAREPQIARTVAPNARLVAQLCTQDPPLLCAAGDNRIITDAGRGWLAEHPT